MPNPPLTRRLTPHDPRPQHLPPITPEARALRAALQGRMSDHTTPIDLSTVEGRIADFFRADRHPATNIGE